MRGRKEKVNTQKGMIGNVKENTAKERMENQKNLVDVWQIHTHTQVRRALQPMINTAKNIHHHHHHYPSTKHQRWVQNKKNNINPSCSLFTLLRFRSNCCHIIRFRSSFFPQAARFLTSHILKWLYTASYCKTISKLICRSISPSFQQHFHPEHNLILIKRLGITP